MDYYDDDYVMVDDDDDDSIVFFPSTTKSNKKQPKKDNTIKVKPKPTPITRSTGPIRANKRDMGLGIEIYGFKQPPLPNLKKIFNYDSMIGEERGRETLNYARFQDAYMEYRQVRCCNGLFYTPKGEILTRDDVQGELIHLLKDLCAWTRDNSRPTKWMVDSIAAQTKFEIHPRTDLIPFANGDLELSDSGWKFILNQYTHLPYRLTVNYIASDDNMPYFTKWLNDTFYEDDIPTIQQFMGACFIPDNKIQEMLIIQGDGGVGKSIIGIILNEMFGKSCHNTKLQTLAENRFESARLENKLVCYDDDLGSAALTETGKLKELITALKPVMAEKKGTNAFEFTPYATFIACSNLPLESLYDASDGFFRRVHTVLTKPKDPNRKDIKNFNELLKNELPQIARWALHGLQDLIRNEWNVHTSERSKQFREAQKGEKNNIPLFFEEVMEFGQGYEITSKELEQLYRQWCDANSLVAWKPQKFKRWISEREEQYGIKYSKGIGRRSRTETGVRGYKGMRKQPSKTSHK